MRNRTNRTMVWIAVWLLSLPVMMMAQDIAVSRGYRLPSKNGSLYGITAGPDAALWFTEYDSNKIGRITTAGDITEYAIPTVSAGPYGITVGPDGALWFTEMSSDTIGRITTAGVITEYPLPPIITLAPSGITAGPDGALWFVMNGCNIGRITTAGVYTEPHYGSCGSGPNPIIAGPDGALWFTQYGYNEIGRITTSGAVTFYSTDSAPNGITLGPDGALWFTEEFGGKIGRITTSGVITEFPLPTPGSQPSAITAGPDGALWFIQAAGTDRVGRITTAGVITLYPAPGSVLGATAITEGPDSELWIADSENDRISEVLFLNANLSVTPATGAYGSRISFAGSGFAPHETVVIYLGGVGSATLASGTADAGGSFTAAARVPQSEVGTRLFVAKGQTSGKLGAANFAIRAGLILQPASGPAGSTVAVHGTGFLPMERLWIYFDRRSTLLGTTSADINGTFEATVTIPSSASAGAHKISVGGDLVSVKTSATFTVQ